MTWLVLKIGKVRYLASGSAAVFLALMAMDIGPESIARSFTWQVMTGTGLLVCMLYQWMIFIQRFTQTTTNARQHYLAHRWVGVGATVLFAVHAVRPGEVWMTALSMIFIAVAVTGLLNREVVKYKKQSMYMAWLAVHMCLSAMLIPFVTVHIWAALAYQ
ncbi:MAG: hypothetical protein MK180_09300 [Rhodobacteraceae bacterium]|nr:hypothetical protein [Paracoccaceae bacterium]